MPSREAVQQFLNTHRSEWGKSGRRDTRNLWSINPSSFTENEAMLAGMRHSCMVIHDVSKKKTPSEMCLSYGGKNNFFEDISQLFLQTGRADLHKSWNKKEVKSRSEKTHQDVKAIAQFPEGHHKQTLSANGRIVQYYVPDHFKTLDQISHGLMPGLASTPADQQKFQVNLLDYSDCVAKAQSLDHFCALTAVKTAQTLKDRGINTKTIAKLLSQNFAQTGIIREQGQINHAQHIVSQTIQEIVATGSLSGLAKEFRHLAQPNVHKYYQGYRNPRLI